MKFKPKKKYCLHFAGIIRHDSSLHPGDTYAHPILNLRQIDEDTGKPGEYGFTDEWNNPLRYDGLTITAQMDNSADWNDRNGIESGMYAIKVQFKHVDCTLENVAKMHKTLKKIDAGLNRIEKIAGPWRSYGALVLRVSRVLNMPVYDEHGWRLEEPAEHIDRKISEMRYELNPTNDEVAA